MPLRIAFSSCALLIEDRPSIPISFASAGEAQARAFTDAGKEIPADLAERMRVMAERRAARAAEQK